MKHATGGSTTTRLDLEFWALLILVAIAVVARLPGHFYPVTLHFDEGLEIWRVIGCFPPCGGTRHPLLNRYLLFIPEGFYFVLGWATGAFSGIADLHQAFVSDPSGFLRAGRVVPLVTGVATVPLTYLLGKYVWDRSVGFAGAFLVAVSPQLVIVSNNLRSWSLGTCLATLSLALLVRAITSPRRRDVFTAGAAAGAGVAAIYVLGLLFLPFAAALLLRWRTLPQPDGPSRRLADLAAAGAGAALAFLIGNLGGVLRWDRVLDELSQLMARDSAFGANTDYRTNLSWYFSSLFEPYGMGPVLASLAIVGLVWTAWRSRPFSWVPVSFAAAVLAIQPLALFLWAGRYAAPAYPVLLLAASALIVDWSRHLARKSPWRSRSQLPVAFVVAALLIAAAGNIATLLDHERVLARPATRQLAKEWIEREIPSGSKLALNIEYVSPVLVDCADQPSDRRLERPCYEIVYLTLPHSTEGARDPAAVAAAHSLAELADDGLDYIVYTDPVPPPSRIRFGWPHWQETFLDDQYELLAEFVYRDLIDIPDDTATVNPKVSIYRVGNLGGLGTSRPRR